MIPRTQRLDVKTQALSQNDFLKILVPKLEKIKKEQDIKELLSKKLLEVKNNCDHSHSILILKFIFFILRLNSQKIINCLPMPSVPSLCWMMTRMIKISSINMFRASGLT